MRRLHMGLVAAAGLAFSVTAAAQAPWYPSKFGANDEIGSANYLTPAGVLQAAQLIKTGKVYSLGITVSTTTPAFPPGPAPSTSFSRVRSARPKVSARPTRPTTTTS